ncbi:hypothetical protein AG0111_0g7805 [Alternaria gaisen]|uniref:Uncharacterized protein n=1 Tax=Alternaria gaisen TaxID=167740 RepID=A0ACB6FIL8_9PLEO|nr:hypothetical protein AG0111_0g7805 [Alternaria gaisen]
MGALLLPFSGIGLGFEAIASLAIRAPTPLTTAARSGALLMIVETEKPGATVPESSMQQASDIEVDQREEPNERTDPEQNTKKALPRLPYRPWTARKIHGNLCLPEGYEFRPVPYYTEFERDEEEVRCKHKDEDKTSKWYDFLFGFSKRNRTTNDVACSYNGAKAIVSIVQTVFGIYTLDRTKGNQIEQFGYAAFGLTVTPYALMSIVNLLGNLMRPDYPSMYIVGSKSSDALQNDYDCTIATVGRIKGGILESEPQKDKEVKLYARRILMIVFYAIFTINLLVVGLMTKFTKGRSTLAQRVWIMIWLVFGMFVGFTLHDMRDKRSDTILNILEPISLEDQRLPETVEASETNQPKRFLMYLFRFFRQTHKRAERFSMLSSKMMVEWVGLDMPSDARDYRLFLAYMVLMYGVPSIGGFVIVAQMIRQYGVCSKMLDTSV